MAGMQIKLKSGRGRPIRLTEDPITIGRHPDNRLRIKDDMSSRHHCVIECVKTAKGATRFRIRDLGSRNGTKLNGMKVTESILSHGDVIRIGQVEFEVEQLGSKLAAAQNGASPAADAGWVGELKSIIGTVSTGGIDDDHLTMIDANGRESGALSAASEGPQAFRLLLRVANRTRATDIHVEPKGEVVNVRMRVDGQMVWICELPNKTGELVNGLVKTACQMHSEGRDAVQDGHFSCRFPDRRVEYRVSLTPSMHGQKMVVRVLDNRGVPMSLADMGMMPYMVERIERVCEQDAGLLLSCGPTGSGKTTTLYNALRQIDRDARNVITIEDPVEYQLDGVTQMPIDNKKGHTFHSLLRSVLRQDPDVILLGEIRDEETARTAMQAAMTGHLVFSTVHSKDSVSSVFRLLDLGVEPYLVANSLQLVLAQRLVRVLCEHCKQATGVPPGKQSKMGRFLGTKTTVHQAVGCKKCLKTGYRGRHALFELLDVNDELRDVILSGAPSIQAMKKVIDQGLFTTLRQFGYRLVAEGVTALDEVDRVAGDS